MRKKALLAFSLTGAMMLGTTAAAAAAPASSLSPVAVRLALADTSTGQPSQQSTGKAKHKASNTLPVILGILALAGVVAAVASSGGNSHPASP